jgi:hypothetical protein
MNRHLHLLAVLNIVYGVLGILPASILFGVLFLIGAVSADPASIAFFSGLGLVSAFFLGLLFLPPVLGGILMLKEQPGARTVLLISGILSLLNFPFGTALGIYTLWVLSAVHDRPPAVAASSAASGSVA